MASILYLWISLVLLLPPGVSSWEIPALIKAAIQKMHVMIPGETKDSDDAINVDIGIPDAEALVGKLFRLPIPWHAFKGNSLQFEVHEAGFLALPAWLYFNHTCLSFYGVPSPLDQGTHVIEVTAYEQIDSQPSNRNTAARKPKSATTNFLVQVRLSHSSLQPVFQDTDISVKLANKKLGVVTSPGMENCLQGENEVKLSLLFDIELSDMVAEDRVDLVYKTSRFVSRPANALMLSPERSSTIHKLLERHVLVAGPGDNMNKTSKAVGTELSWIISCGDFDQADDVVKVMSHNINSGRLRREIGKLHPIKGWYLSQNNAPGWHARHRRAAAIQGTATPLPSSSRPTRVMSIPTTVISDMSSHSSQPLLVLSSSAMASSMLLSSAKSVTISMTDIEPSRSIYVTVQPSHSSFSSSIPDLSSMPKSSSLFHTSASEQFSHIPSSFLSPHIDLSSSSSYIKPTVTSSYLSSSQSALMSPLPTSSVFSSLSSGIPSSTEPLLSSFMTPDVSSTQIEVVPTPSLQSSSEFMSTSFDTSSTLLATSQVPNDSSASPISSSVSPALASSIEETSSIMPTPSIKKTSSVSIFPSSSISEKVSVSIFPSSTITAVTLSSATVHITTFEPEMTTEPSAEDGTTTEFKPSNATTLPPVDPVVTDSSTEPSTEDITPISNMTTIQPVVTTTKPVSSTHSNTTEAELAATTQPSVTTTELTVEPVTSDEILNTTQADATTQPVTSDDILNTTQADATTQPVTSYDILNTTQADVTTQPVTDIPAPDLTTNSSLIDGNTTEAQSTEAVTMVSQTEYTTLSPTTSEAEPNQTSESPIVGVQTTESPIHNTNKTASPTNFTTESPVIGVQTTQSQTTQVQTTESPTTENPEIPDVTTEVDVTTEKPTTISTVTTNATTIADELTTFPVNNEITTVLTTEGPKPNKGPIRNNSIGRIYTDLGTYFSFIVPEDTFYDEEEGNTRNLQLSLSTGTGEEILESSWVLFDDNNQLIYGLPLNKDVMQRTEVFILTATDSGGLTAKDVFEVKINISTLEDISFSFSSHFGIDFDDFMLKTSNVIELVSRLSTYFGDPKSSDYLSVVDILNGSVNMQWTNNTISKVICENDTILELYSLLKSQQGWERIINPAFRRAMFPEYPVTSVSMKWLGVCLIDSPPTTDPTAGEVGGGGFPIWLAIFLPFLILLLIVVILILICCLLHRRRHKKAGQWMPEDEKPIFGYNRKPVLMENELEMQDSTTKPRKPMIMSEDSSQPYRYANPGFAAAAPPPPAKQRQQRRPPPEYRSRPPSRQSTSALTPDIDDYDEDDGSEASTPRDSDRGYTPPGYYLDPALRNPPPSYRLPPPYIGFPGHSEI